jgi:hypothetical protein
MAEAQPHAPAPWALKGGYALELRFRSARSTIDIDLTVRQAKDALRRALMLLRRQTKHVPLKNDLQLCYRNGQRRSFQTPSRLNTALSPHTAAACSPDCTEPFHRPASRDSPSLPPSSRTDSRC